MDEKSPFQKKPPRAMCGLLVGFEQADQRRSIRAIRVRVRRCSLSSAYMLGILVLLFAALIAFANSADQAIRRVLSDQVQAWNRGDIDAFMNGYENSAGTVFIGKTVQRGYKAVRRRYHEQYPTPEKMGKLSFSDLSVNLLGDGYASVTGAFHLIRAGSAGGNASGVFSLLLRRTPAGWKIILDH